MILRARFVLPIGRPLIENGAVQIAGEHIVACGRWEDLKADAGTERVEDLGERLILPGLINAHCHLDYTDMAGLIPPLPGFPAWIKSITTLKAGWSYSEFAASWLRGARMLLQTGTTTVADIEAAPELLPEVWTSAPLRICSFLEMTGVKSRRDPQAILADALAKIESLPGGRCQAGLSPHAPYSTTPALLRLSADAARERDLRLTTHVAESREEFEMFTRSAGDMHEWLARNERDLSDCGGVSPVQALARLNYLSPRLLAVHVNQLAVGDAELLAEHGVSVAHCPRSHAYFQHAPFPYAELAAAGVNVCLGTDSLATVRRPQGVAPSLNLFSEMRAFSRSFLDIDSATIVRLATINGARALGLADRGSLEPGRLADLIAILFDGSSDDVWDAVVHHTSKPEGVMIGGRWEIAPFGI